MPTSTRKPSPYERAGSAEINAMVERVAPAILELLADDMPRSKPAIVAALAGRHDKQDVVNALIRLGHRRGGADRQQVHVGDGGRGRAARGRLTRGVRQGPCGRSWALQEQGAPGKSLPPADGVPGAPGGPARGRYGGTGDGGVGIG